MKTTQEFCESYISADESKAAASLAAMQAAAGRLPRDTVDGDPLLLPKVFDAQQIADFQEVVEMTYAICTKVIDQYLKNPEYRNLFPFSDALKEAILANPGYEELLPVARFDIFYNEETGAYKFCEINTDGTSAMLETTSWDTLFQSTPLYKELAQNYELHSYELFEHWIDTFLSVYQESSMAKESPHIAVADFLEIGTVREFEEFVQRFQKRGFEAQVVDLRDLVYQNGQLQTKDGFTIDAIYRRAVTSEIIDHKDEVAGFLQAIKDGAVFVCGALRTQIPHCKPFFEILYMDETLAFLTEEEQQFIHDHIPYTLALAPGGISVAEASQDKDSRILKPNDSFGAHGVTAGKDLSQEEWESMLADAYNKGYVVQEFVTPYETKNFDLSGEWHNYMNLTGLYSFRGKFSGIYSRLSRNTIITTHNNGHSVATYGL